MDGTVVWDLCCDHLYSGLTVIKSYAGQPFIMPPSVYVNI